MTIMLDPLSWWFEKITRHARETGPLDTAHLARLWELTCYYADGYLPEGALAAMDTWITNQALEI